MATERDAFPIYWEKQESALCGTHCLNNLLQGSFFDEVTMSEIAASIDASERALMLEAGEDSAAYLSFMAQDSSNVDASGNFSSEVLKRCLQNFSLDFSPINSPDKKHLKANIGANCEALVCNLQSHWLAIRKLKGQWFNLNSLQQSEHDNNGWGPSLLSDFYLETYLQELQARSYTIFVVESPSGSFPPVDTSVDVASRGGRWFDSRQVIEFTKHPERLKRLQERSAPAASRGGSTGGDAALARALAASVAPQLTGGSNTWPPPPSERYQPQPDVTPSTRSAFGGGFGGEDDDLARAIAASMQDVAPPVRSSPLATAAAAAPPTRSSSGAAAAAVAAAQARAAAIKAPSGAAASTPAAAAATSTPIAVASPPAAAAASPAAGDSATAGLSAGSTVPAIATPMSPEMLDAALAVLMAAAQHAPVQPAATTAPAATIAAPPAPAPAASALAEDDEDAEMRRAIEMSMQQQ